MTECARCGRDPGEGLFCHHCGLLVEAGSLQRVRIDTFMGTESLNPKVEQFFETGDPDSLS